MTTYAEAQELLGDDDFALAADGLEEAFIGLANRNGETLAVYSAQRATTIFARQAEEDCESAARADDPDSVGTLVDHRNCEHFEEAKDMFGYNTLGSWVGPGTPLWIDTVEDDWEYEPRVPAWS